MALVLNSHRAPGKLVLERVSYLRDSGGKRETAYIGRISAAAPYSSVSAEILEKLSESEREDLRIKLLPNEPKQFQFLHNLKTAIQICQRDLDSVPESEKMAARLMLAEVEGAWRAFGEHAQALGIKRKRSPAAPAPAPAPAPRRKRGA